MKYLHSIKWVVAGFAMNHLLGVPFVGTLIAKGFRLLADGTNTASNAVSDYIKYQTPEEANAAINAATLQGATIERFHPNDDGSTAIKWNTDAYTGSDLTETEVCMSTEMFDLLSE